MSTGEEDGTTILVIVYSDDTKGMMIVDIRVVLYAQRMGTRVGGGRKVCGREF